MSEILDENGNPIQLHVDAPSRGEILFAMEEALDHAGIPFEAVDVIEGEHTIPQLGAITQRVFPVHIAVVKDSGLVLYFAAAGPGGIHARILRMRGENNEG